MNKLGHGIAKLSFLSGIFVWEMQQPPGVDAEKYTAGVRQPGWP